VGPNHSFLIDGEAEPENHDPSILEPVDLPASVVATALS
jgi:hypothetical protein